MTHLTPAPTTATDLAGAARGSSEAAMASTGRGRRAGTESERQGRHVEEKRVEAEGEAVAEVSI